MQDLKIQKIIDQIIRETGMTNMSEELEVEFRKNMEAEITKRIGIIALESLDDEGLKKIEGLSKKDRENQDVIKEIINTHSKNFEENLKTGLQNLIKEVVSASKEWS